MIVQSNPTWMAILKDAINKQLTELAPNVIYTTSFDHAIDLATKEEEILVICSDMYHDRDSEHYGSVTEKLPDNEKDSLSLAKLIKSINKKSQVYVFSDYAPNTFSNLDGYISKNVPTDVSIPKVLQTIKRKIN